MIGWLGDLPQGKIAILGGFRILAATNFGEFPSNGDSEQLNHCQTYHIPGVRRSGDMDEIRIKFLSDSADF